jgi:hypothetical protein
MPLPTPAPFSPHITLRELGLPFELERVDLAYFDRMSTRLTVQAALKSEEALGDAVVRVG